VAKGDHKISDQCTVATAMHKIGSKLHLLPEKYRKFDFYFIYIQFYIFIFHLYIYIFGEKYCIYCRVVYFTLNRACDQNGKMSVPTSLICLTISNSEDV
jgi:hypothetical protein